MNTTEESGPPMPAPHVPQLLWEVRVVYERESGARRVRCQDFTVPAESAESAQRLLALHLGTYYKGARIRKPEPFVITEPLGTGSFHPQRADVDETRGRLVSDILCEIAVERGTK